MAGDASIIASFGGDTSQLRASTEEANIIVKGFGRQAGQALREIGNGFILPVIMLEGIRAVKEFAAEAVDSAQQSRDALLKIGDSVPYTTGLLANMGDGFKTIKDAGTAFVGTVLTGLAEIGDGFGTAINWVRGYSLAEQQANADSEANTNATLARIAAARDKYLAELPGKMAAATAAADKQEEENAKSQLSAASNLQIVDQQIAQLQDAMANTNQDSLRYEQQRGDVAKLTAEQIKYQGQVTGENAKKDEQLAKVQKQYYDDMNKAVDEALNSLPDVTEEWVKQQYAAGLITDEQVKQIGFGPQLIDIQTKIADEAKRAADEAERKAKAEQAAIDLANRKAAAALNVRGGAGGGTDYTSDSDATLQDIINKARQDQVAIATNPNGNGNGLGSDYATAIDAGKITAAQQELDFRNQLRTNNAVGGEAYARAQFQGDPGQFEKVFAQIVGTAGGGLGANQQTQQDIHDISTVLKTNFT